MQEANKRSKGLFEEIGPVLSVEILFDRKSDRSRGIAFVIMKYSRHADEAVKEFDGADANKQPIRVTRVPSGRSARNPFDHVERPGKSLFERIQPPRSTSPTDDENPRSRRNRRDARSDVARGSTPEGVDRYVPGRSERALPSRRNNESRRRGARNGPGQQKERERTDKRGPKKTQEQLDNDMAEYFNGGAAQATELNGNGTVPSTAPAAVAGNADIDMIE